jgi:hypothetical protein
MFWASKASFLLLFTYSSFSSAESDSWRLELKTLDCHQVQFTAVELGWALAANGNPCNPIGDRSEENSFVLIECPRTGTNYVIAPTKNSCQKAAAKLKPVHSAIKNSEGPIPLKKIEEKQKGANVAAPKKDKSLVKKSAAKSTSSLIGRWAQACAKSDGAGDITTHDFQDQKSFLIHIDQYSSEDCTKDTHYQRISLKGTYELSPEKKIKSEAHPITMIITSVSFIIFDSVYASEQSENSKFGLMSIVPKKEYDISASKEFSSVIGKKSYGMYLIEGADLFFNKDTGGIVNTDPDTSKLQIDRSKTYTRELID